MRPHVLLRAGSEQLRRLIRSGALGSLRRVRSTRASRGIVQRDVDVFWDLAAHDVAILQRLVPEWDPHRVSARGVDPLALGHPCAGEVSIEARSGPHVTVAVSWLSPTKVRTIELVGTEGTITWDDVARRRLRTDVPGLAPPRCDPAEPLHMALADFVRSIHHGRSPIADTASAVRVLRVLEAISRSAQDDGLPVTVATEGVDVGPRQPA